MTEIPKAGHSWNTVITEKFSDRTTQGLNCSSRQATMMVAKRAKIYFALVALNSYHRPQDGGQVDLVCIPSDSCYTEFRPQAQPLLLFLSHQQ